MTNWRLARSLERLREQINALAPSRSKASDGSIGDAAHASRDSDHNPWVKDGAVGVVTAIDITHDPAHGVDIQKLADALLASKDARIKYVICNGRIASGNGQKHPAWQWRPYGGSNRHNKHVHVSVKATKAFYDDMRDWRLSAQAMAEVAPADSVLKLGSKGPFVTELQGNLNQLGYPVKVDGVFGQGTEAAVRGFQKRAGLAVDGWAGPRTIKAIGEALAAQAAAPKIETAAQTVPETAGEEVSAKAGWWQKVTAVLSGGGAIGGWLYGLDWQTVAVVVGAGVLVLLLILLLRRQIIAAFRDINQAVEGR